MRTYSSETLRYLLSFMWFYCRQDLLWDIQLFQADGVAAFNSVALTEYITTVALLFCFAIFVGAVYQNIDQPC